jgi:hypothetical protein
MSKPPIFTVGFELPGDDFEYIPFRSDRTLLDAEIVLLEPTLGDPSFGYADDYNGVPVLTHESGNLTSQAVSHWRTEIIAAISAGKLVVVYLSKPKQYYRYTGQQTHSGTGRSRVTTNIVNPISSYDAVPMLRRITPKTGSQVALTKDGAAISSYWTEFADTSVYEVEIEVEDKVKSALTVAGQRVVGAIFRGKFGNLLYLPPIRYDEKKFLQTKTAGGHSKTYWTADALRFGKKLSANLHSLAKGLRTTDRTPPPAWAQGVQFQTALEASLELSLAETQERLGELNKLRVEQESNLVQAGSLRALLYEQGRGLENAVLEAMTLFGFKAHRVAEGQSEFDAILESPEGRCLGEAEGKDNKAINIEKFGQLERNLQEDFAREDVNEYAKGILFGNAQRLLPLDKRGEYFTEKCISAAQRVGVALVRTPDLFEPARYLRENPTDAPYATACREALFNTKGKVVTFPASPSATQIAPPQEAVPDPSNN